MTRDEALAHLKVASDYLTAMSSRFLATDINDPNFLQYLSERSEADRIYRAWCKYVYEMGDK